MRMLLIIGAGVACMAAFSQSGAVAQPDLEVTGIIAGDKPFAIVNGQVVSVGNMVDGMKVSGIGEDTVDFTYGDFRVTVKVGEKLAKADYPAHQVRLAGKIAEKGGARPQEKAPPAPPPGPSPAAASAAAAVAKKEPPPGRPQAPPAEITGETPVSPVERAPAAVKAPSAPGGTRLEREEEAKEAAEELGMGGVIRVPAAEGVAATPESPSPAAGAPAEVPVKEPEAAPAPPAAPTIPETGLTPSPAEAEPGGGTESRRIEIEKIGSEGSASAIGFLIEALRDDPDSGVRAEAAKALGRIGGPDSVAPLLGALKDRDSTVRLFASMGIFWLAQNSPGILKGRGSMDALIAALGDPNEMVRWNVVDIMGELGDRRTITPLLEALKRERDTDLVSIIEETLLSMRGIDDPAMREFLAAREDVNWKDYGQGQTRLHKAAYFGRNDEILTLLSRGADINAKDREGKTPLILAIANAPRDTVNLLLSMGAGVGMKDAQGDSPLHYAAMSGDERLVEMVLARGADINAKNNEGYTPLDLALEFGRQEMALCLMKNGAEQKTAKGAGPPRAPGEKLAAGR